MRSAAVVALCVCTACNLEVGKGIEPVKGGAGVSIDAGVVTVDLDKVPIVPSCGAGQFVRRTSASSWECAMPDWTAVAAKPEKYPPAAHAHAAADVTDLSGAIASAQGAKANSNPTNHDRYTDGEAVAAMGVKGNANALNHDRYTDAEVLAAVKAADKVGIGVVTATAKLHVAGNVRIDDGTQAAGRVLTSDNTGTASWQAIPQGATVPTGAVMFFNLSSCPSGWSELSGARGRYIVGLPLNGTLGSPVGAALSDQENRATGQHGHSVNDPGHTHSYTNNGIWQYYCGGNYCQTQYGSSQQTGTPQQTDGGAGTGITVNDSGSVAGTNAPYIQLLVCQKN